jgi:D-glycerate 3-kinase
MKAKKNSFLNLKKQYLQFLIKQEELGEPFLNKTQQLKKFYIPISKIIHQSYLTKKKTIVIGISGGQGSGKTTVSKILRLVLKNSFNLNVISFSIDDFYKTFNERKKMSKKTHELFLTRGVPGTHDVNMINNCFKKLLKKKFIPFLIPKFDKSIDDRASKKKWQKVNKKPNVIIFEGWCVGARHQRESQLKKPINSLEKNHDRRLIWRKKVNNELKNRYTLLFKLIDKLIFLKVPSFKYVYEWRLLQEKKIRKFKKKKTMSDAKIKEFIMFYERITKQMTRDLNKKANVVINLDEKHRLNDIKIN